MLHSAEQFADAVASGFRPARLKAIPDLIWELICDCTHKDTAARPRINQVLQRLQGYEGELLHATPAAGENKCGCILS